MYYNKVFELKKKPLCFLPNAKHNVKYKTQREVQNTTGSTKHNVKDKTQREVQTFDYENKEVIDLTHYLT